MAIIPALGGIIPLSGSLSRCPQRDQKCPAFSNKPLHLVTQASIKHQKVSKKLKLLFQNLLFLGFVFRARIKNLSNAIFNNEELGFLQVGLQFVVHNTNEKTPFRLNYQYYQKTS